MGHIKMLTVRFGLIFFCLLLCALEVTPVSAINREKEFIPIETYHYLFYTGLEITRKNMPLEIMVTTDANLRLTRPYTVEPRLYKFTRPRFTEYTTFSFYGYLNQTDITDPLNTTKIPGKWHFKVRWKHSRITRGRQKLGIIEFCEVMPDIYFIKHDSTMERKDFRITTRYPDPMIHQKTVFYKNGVFDIDTQRNNINGLLK